MERKVYDIAKMQRESLERNGCPRCGCKDWRGEGNSSVESTRHPEDGAATVRRRICRHCGKTAWVTQEVEVPKGFKVVVVPDEDEERACA